MPKPAGYRRRFTLEVSLPELQAMRAAARKAGFYVEHDEGKKQPNVSAWLRALVRQSLESAAETRAVERANAGRRV